MNKFSLQLDEPTYESETLLLTFVRFYDLKKIFFVNQFFFIDRMETTSKGVNIFDKIKNYFEENEISFLNCVSIAWDGAPSISVKNKGFIALFKKVNPNVMSIHCSVHRYQLAVKKIPQEINCAFETAIKVINKIKGIPLNSRFFKKIAAENNELFDVLLFNTNDRWLSAGNALARLFQLSVVIQKFLEEFKFVDLLVDFLKKFNYYS